LVVFILGADFRARKGPVGRGDVEAAAIVIREIAPGFRVLVERVEAYGEFFPDRAVHIEGGAHPAPRADRKAGFAERLVGARLLGQTVDDAAEAARADEQRVGSAREVDALLVVGVGVGAEQEKIALRGVGLDAARHYARAALV